MKMEGQSRIKRDEELKQAKLDNLDHAEKKIAGRNLTNHAMVHIGTDLREVGAVPLLDFLKSDKKELKSISVESFKSMMLEKEDFPHLKEHHEKLLFVSTFYSVLAEIKDINDKDELTISLHNKLDKWSKFAEKNGFDPDFFLHTKYYSGIYEDGMNPGHYDNYPTNLQVHEVIKAMHKKEVSISYDEFLDFIGVLNELSKDPEGKNNSTDSINIISSNNEALISVKDNSQSQSRTFQTVDFSTQRVPENVVAQSRELFEKLSLEDQEKFNNTFVDFKDRLLNLGIENIDVYNVFFFDGDDNKYGSYVQSFEGESYVQLNINKIAEMQDFEIRSLLFHEYFGHALTSKNILKKSDLLKMLHNGLSFTKVSGQADKISFDGDTLKDMMYTYNNGGLAKLEELELQALKGLMKKTNHENLIEFLDQLTDNLHLITEDSYYQVVTDNVNEIGKPLNEGVTEYLAIVLSADNQEELSTLLTDNPYEKYYDPIFDLVDHIENIGQGIDDFNRVLFDARLEGSPKIIIDYIYEKTGLKIKPKELFNLDFSRVLNSQ